MPGILIVDDEPAIRKLATIALRSDGYTVIEAANGLEALALFRSYGPDIDVLLTDMVMPVMGGAEAIARIRETHPDLKVICMTGFTDSGIPNGVRLLAKPFLPADLLAAVREILG